MKYIIILSCLILASCQPASKKPIKRAENKIESNTQITESSEVNQQIDMQSGMPVTIYPSSLSIPKYFTTIEVPAPLVPAYINFPKSCLKFELVEETGYLIENENLILDLGYKKLEFKRVSGEAEEILGEWYSEKIFDKFTRKIILKVEQDFIKVTLKCSLHSKSENTILE